MTRTELCSYLSETYSVESDFPWAKYASYEVFRHKDSRKWFAVVMDINESKLGISGDRIISVVNLKTDPIMSGTLVNEKGIYPAYHMNKTSWITVVTEEADDSTLKMLAEISYRLTSTEKKRGKKREKRES